MTSTRHHVAGAGSAATIEAPRTMAAREHRAKHLKPDLARVMRLARETEQASQRDVAADLDVQQPLVHHWEQRDEPHAPSVLHVHGTRMRAIAEALIRWQATPHGLDVVAAARVVHGDNHAARLAAVTVECSDPARELAIALADNALTDTELEQLERHFREAAEVALEGATYFSQELRRRRAERCR